MTLAMNTHWNKANKAQIRWQIQRKYLRIVKQMPANMHGGDWSGRCLEKDELFRSTMGCIQHMQNEKDKNEAFTPNDRCVCDVYGRRQRLFWNHICRNVICLHFIIIRVKKSFCVATFYFQNKYHIMYYQLNNNTWVVSFTR